jgi:hypothetical protein
MTYRKRRVIFRFFARVVMGHLPPGRILTPCWLWTGCLDPSGYGQIRINGRLHLVHKLSYQIFKGVLPPPHLLILHHRCRNSICVNPEHLKLVTPSQHCAIHRRKQARDARGWCRELTEPTSDNGRRHRMRRDAQLAIKRVMWLN